MTYHLVCNWCNTMGATSEAGTAYPFGAHEFTPLVFSGVPVARSLVFCVVFYRSLFVLLSFFFSPLCCLSLDLPHWYLQAFLISNAPLRILITPLVYGFWFPLWFTNSDYPFGLRLLITHLVYRFWLPPLVFSNSSSNRRQLLTVKWLRQMCRGQLLTVKLLRQMCRG